MSANTTPTAVMPASASAASGTEELAGHHLRRFRFDRPQKFAALLLFCCSASALAYLRTPLTNADYQYARCGREMWERPSPIAGYFTTCGNIHDGALAYRLAGLPLTVERVLAGNRRRPPPGRCATNSASSACCCVCRLPLPLCCWAGRCGG